MNLPLFDFHTSTFTLSFTIFLSLFPDKHLSYSIQHTCYIITLTNSMQ